MSKFHIILAPPAWGKTSKILEIIKENNICVFLSPLRALAEEFKKRAQSTKDIFVLERSELASPLRGSSWVFICTPESVMNSVVFFRFIQKQNPIFILDEFHLFLKWGICFRPILLDFIIKYYDQILLSICLTATWDQECENTMELFFSSEVEYLHYYNHGNLQLIFKPQNNYIVPIHFIQLIPFFCKLRSPYKGCVLIFCKYRKEVIDLARDLRISGLKTISCIGGEVKTFIEDMSQISNPDVIVATKTLSHGVNLPAINTIIFTYNEKDQAFKIQMVGRGGRRGEVYCVLQVASWNDCLKELYFFFYNKLSRLIIWIKNSTPLLLKRSLLRKET